MKKQYLCSPIMGERLRIPVNEYGTDSEYVRLLAGS